MHVRLLAPDDQAQLEAFLTAHWTAAMFLRSNLRATPLGADGPYSGPWAGAFNGDALIAVASSVARMGNVILAGDPAAAAACARRVTTAAQVRGVLGPWRCVTAAVDQLELTAQPVLSGAPEILYRLDISVLRDPVSAVRCRRATKEDLDWLTPWRVAYAVETLGAKPGPDVEPTVFANLCDQIAEGRLFVAHREEEPVATCCFNAELPDVVQIGAVWTPPTMRGRGYARAVVAGALRIAQQEGVMRAVLFTEETNTPAQRAYEALGFARVGDYGMMLYDLN